MAHERSRWSVLVVSGDGVVVKAGSRQAVTVFDQMKKTALLE